MSEQVRLIAGEDAHRLLHDRAFRRAWDALADACPWGTVFQRAPYAGAWFAAYASDQTPVFVIQYDAADRLVGLLVLARARNDGNSGLDDSVAHVGRHQAEYQVWLASPSHAATFPVAALLAIRDAYPQLSRLRLTYLPADVPMDWIPVLQRAGLHVGQQAHRRGLMRVDAEGTIEKSLRKSANRSRLSRLQRLGPVTLEQIDTRETLTPLMDEIVLHCDLRHGAQHGVLPFADDPRKREFQLSLLDTPGLAHATVLRAGATLVAAHLSVADHRAVPLGIVTHSPTHAACSPGKLLLLLLGQQLGAQGYTWFDLTPGGDAYKERFATASDEVWSVEVWFDTAAANAAMRRQQRRLVLRGAMERLRQRIGTRWTPIETGLRRLIELHQAHRANRGSISALVAVVTTALHQLRRWIWDTREIRTYHRTTPTDMPSMDPSSTIGTQLRQHALDDLLCYRPRATGDRPRREFLRDALASLERGNRSLTWVSDGTLQYCGWIESDGVLRDDVVHPAARRNGLDEAIEHAGFAYAGSRWVGVRFGRRREWSTVNALS